MGFLSSQKLHGGLENCLFSLVECIKINTMPSKLVKIFKNTKNTPRPLFLSIVDIDLEGVFGVDEAALEISSFIRIWSVGVDQWHEVGEPVELGHLEVNVVEAADKDPESLVVETPEGSDKLEKSLKVDCSLLVIKVIVEPCPGDDGQGHRS